LQFTVNRGIVFDVVYISAGIAVQVGLARVLEWNRGAAKNEEQQDLMVEAPQRAS
jgi:hypothetical protein